MIAAGTLRYILKFKQLEEIQSDSGFITKSKIDLFTTRAAKVKSTGNFGLNAKELFHDNELIFKIRNNNLLVDDLIVEYNNNEYNITLLDYNEFDNSVTITLQKVNI
ncbi:head-tail adaptor protein [uncultured Bacteroides sp.]|uniref:phage head completion protein n=1 Tax=uncultured Bacteroides sp. TaxID=162156 RepID=UPI002AA63949|nr:head-tail adaptor protein [uncultured Bacteroides sp.]